MRVIVTRPEREAHAWAEALLQRGMEVVELPLISILAVSDPAAICAAWRRLNEYAAVMFVSGAAVEYFFALRPAAAVGLGSDISGGWNSRFWGTGPGTYSALLRQGAEPGRIDTAPLVGAQFDSEALWKVVAKRVRPGDRILIVRGGDAAADLAVQPAAPAAGSGRDWLAQRLLHSGARVEFLQAYLRCVPAWDATQRALACDAASDGSVWLFTSAQAVANLGLCMPGQNWAGARALATHPRIAGAARAAGFAVVRESRPGVADVVASIESGG